MSDRRRLSERKVIEVLINQGAIIPCGICRLAFKAEDVKHIERDHERCKHTIADEDMEDWDTIERQRYVHGRNDPKNDCHAKKTADDRRIKAKHDRIKGITKAEPKAKIRSAGFQTNRDGPLKQKMSGKVVSRA
jgi:hypothetical protein